MMPQYREAQRLMQFLAEEVLRGAVTLSMTPRPLKCGTARFVVEANLMVGEQSVPCANFILQATESDWEVTSCSQFADVLNAIIERRGHRTEM